MWIQYLAFLGGVCLTLSGCDALRCHPPADGPPPAGRWGGEEWTITVQPDGTAWVEGLCSAGAVTEPIQVVEGKFEFEVKLVTTGVEPATSSFVAIFRGEVCGDVMQGEVQVDRSLGEFDVMWGDPAAVPRCDLVTAPLPGDVPRPESWW